MQKKLLSLLIFLVLAIFHPQAHAMHQQNNRSAAMLVIEAAAIIGGVTACAVGYYNKKRCNQKAQLLQKIAQYCKQHNIDSTNLSHAKVVSLAQELDQTKLLLEIIKKQETATTLKEKSFWNTLLLCGGGVTAGIGLLGLILTLKQRSHANEEKPSDGSKQKNTPKQTKLPGQRAQQQTAEKKALLKAELYEQEKQQKKATLARLEEQKQELSAQIKTQAALIKTGKEKQADASQIHASTHAGMLDLFGGDSDTIQVLRKRDVQHDQKMEHMRKAQRENEDRQAELFQQLTFLNDKQTEIKEDWTRVKEARERFESFQPFYDAASKNAWRSYQGDKKHDSNVDALRKNLDPGIQDLMTQERKKYEQQPDQSSYTIAVNALNGVQTDLKAQHCFALQALNKDLNRHGATTPNLVLQDFISKY